MKLLFSPRFLKQYRDAPLQVQKAFDKQVRLLVQDLRHPSLHAKKYDANCILVGGRAQDNPSYFRVWIHEPSQCASWGFEAAPVIPVFIR